MYRWLEEQGELRRPLDQAPKPVDYSALPPDVARLVLSIMRPYCAENARGRGRCVLGLLLRYVYEVKNSWVVPLACKNCPV